MAKKELSQAALVAQVIARQKFLEDVSNFASAILQKKGTVLFHHVHDWYTEDKIELAGFNGFSFFYHGSQSQMGGEELRVWYHPGTVRDSQSLVLDMRWQVITECRVQTFRPSQEWQRQLRILMRDKDKAVAKHEREQKRAADKAKRAAESEKCDSAIARSLEKDRARLALA